MEVPRMYRAQWEERCQLQFVPKTEDRDQWLKEWIDPEGNGNVSQHSLGSKPEGYDGSVYRIRIKFPYRVFTNSGQDDNIQRPPFGKKGIPFIPGSSIKGLFRRVCNHEDKLFYCGSTDKPGCLRFHGAYPIGDWTGKVRFPITRNGEQLSETCYTILDIAHPQQEKQVERQETTNANTFISLLEPTLVFEFSNNDKNSDRKIDWQEVKSLLETALKQGLGGKTSNCYGISGKPDFVTFPETIHLSLSGSGVSSTLLKGKVDLRKNWSGNEPQGQGKPEFRHNIFKASLRGHVSRILAGVCHDKELVKKRTNELFGSSDKLGGVKIFWEQTRKPQHNSKAKNPTYSAQGILHIYSQENQSLIQQVVQFAYVLGGFGKTWRRVSHEHFFPSYHQNNFAIGCHWVGTCTGFEPINNRQDLAGFLNRLYHNCQQYLSIDSPTSIREWREAWHPARVAVYSEIFSESEISKKSQAIELFHQEPFKHTPAIGGRNPSRDENKKSKLEFVSSVWHRMLPIYDGKQYLEIVTVFHGDRTPWRDQLRPFINSLKHKGLQLSWGQEPR
ncbi:RAMP superfamily CRISPR-associated protein [Scytonema sp. PCC 10023]|uniref:RAMP superfamily CRISPR-associated protein n=1 Tax=Scytonema sp. PCC 10023 TaxID=1680591 RepID=UPI0039C642A8